MKKHEETLFEFPCEFPLKIVGRASLNFEGLVFAILRRHAPDLSEAALTLNHSKNGNYVSITATINATSKAQLDALYLELSQQKEILFAL